MLPQNAFPEGAGNDAFGKTSAMLIKWRTSGFVWASDCITFSEKKQMIKKPFLRKKQSHVRTRIEKTSVTQIIQALNN